MDLFVDNNIIINNMIQKQNNNESLFIQTRIIQKQYHVYYLYRIICKYFSFFRSMALVNLIKEINSVLLIPDDYKYVCYPLVGHLTTDETILDKAFDLMINIFKKAKFKLIETKRDTNSDIEDYLRDKTPDIIIKDIKQLIKYVPGLSSHLVAPIYS